VDRLTPTVNRTTDHGVFSSTARTHLEEIMNKLFAAALATSTAVAVAAPATPASASSCAVTWGSLAKTAPPSHAKPVTNQPSEIVGLRTGRHACYDRLVIDTDAPIGAGVRYVKAVTDQGRGDVVPLRPGCRSGC